MLSVFLPWQRQARLLGFLGTIDGIISKPFLSIGGPSPFPAYKISTHFMSSVYFFSSKLSFPFYSQDNLKIRKTNITSSERVCAPKPIGFSI